MAIEESERVGVNGSINTEDVRRPDPFEGQTNAPDILQFMQGTDMATSMSPEGVAYIKAFKEYLEARNVNGASFAMNSMTNPAEAQVVTCTKGGRRTGVVLVFDETIVRMNQNYPTVAVAKMVIDQFRINYPNVEFLQMIVITKQDYPKVRPMAANVVNKLLAVNENSLTVDSFKNYRIEIVPNIGQVKTFIDHLSGHGVPDRMDYGFLINLVTSTNKSDTRNFFSQSNEDRKTLAAVTGYTTFVQNLGYVPPAGAPTIKKFYPVVHISNIVSPIQVYGMLALVLPLAAMSFLDYGQWEAPFKQFGAAGSVNIGNLIMGNDGQPFSISNLQEFSQFKQLYLENPVLVLDSTFGRFSVPGLSHIGTVNANNYNADLELRRAMAKFLKTDLMAIAANDEAPFGRLVNVELTGTVGIGGALSDSRYADYLNLMIYHGKQMSRLNDLLMPLENYELVANIIREFCPDFNPLYMTNRLIVNPRMIAAMKAELQKQVRLIRPETGDSYINTAVYSDFAQQYNAFGGVGGGFVNVNSPFINNANLKLF